MENSESWWGSNPEKNWIANSFVRKTGLGWTQNVEPRKSMHRLEMDRNTIFFVLKIALISFLPECWLWSCCKNNILISFQLEDQFEIFNQRRIQLISPISNQDDFAVKKMILCKPESWVDLVRQSLRCFDLHPILYGIRMLSYWLAATSAPFHESGVD